jgi:hypothetical protein
LFEIGSVLVKRSLQMRAAWVTEVVIVVLVVLVGVFVVVLMVDALIVIVLSD